MDKPSLPRDERVPEVAPRPDTDFVQPQPEAATPGEGADLFDTAPPMPIPADDVTPLDDEPFGQPEPAEPAPAGDELDLFPDAGEADSPPGGNVPPSDLPGDDVPAPADDIPDDLFPPDEFPPANDAPPADDEDLFFDPEPVGAAADDPDAAMPDDAIAPDDFAPGDAAPEDNLFDDFGDPAEDPVPADDAGPPAEPADEPADDEELNVDDLFGVAPPSITRPAVSSKAVAATSPVPVIRRGVRVWTDDTGKYQTVARLVVIAKTHVRLLKQNGRYTTVPLGRLSQADLDYVMSAAQKLASGDVPRVASIEDSRQ